MKSSIKSIAIFCILQSALCEEIRLLDLDPPEAQQYIDKQDTSLKYAPKIESNVPAVRFLGNEPHNVAEDIYLANQYHGQDGLGGYLYGYSVPDIAKTEKKKAGGDLRGAYNYIAGNGQEIKVEYWDDGTGFHQIDNVPKILPKQIEDTPEVKAAKEEHARIWQEQAERNSRPIADPYASHGAQQTQQYQQQQQYQQPQQQYKQPQQQYQQSQQQHQQPQQQYQQPQQQYQQSQQQHQQPQQHQQQFQQPQQQYQQPQQHQQQFQQPQQQYQQPQQQYQPTQQQHKQPQAQQLVNQYQQQKQQYPNPGQSVHYQGEQGQQTQNVNRYQASGQLTGQQGAQYSAQSSYSQQGQDGGQYSGQDEGQWSGQDEEEKGPPKGFFYSFDYPVGIIVSKDGGGPVQKRDVKDVYAVNKANFEKQLQQGSLRPARGAATGYLFIKE